MFIKTTIAIVLLIPIACGENERATEECETIRSPFYMRYAHSDYCVCNMTMMKKDKPIEKTY